MIKNQATNFNYIPTFDTFWILRYIFKTYQQIWWLIVSYIRFFAFPLCCLWFFFRIFEAKSVIPTNKRRKKHLFVLHFCLLFALSSNFPIFSFSISVFRFFTKIFENATILKCEHKRQSPTSLLVFAFLTQIKIKLEKTKRIKYLSYRIWKSENTIGRK